jgi:GT2 family glycosyltransferase
MGKVIAPLAKGSVPARTIFDRRFVVECCERFHLHWRNLRLELTADNWIEFARTFEAAIATWRANGSPREHFHLELGKYLMDTSEIVHPETVEVELCENLYKSMRDTHGADAEFWSEDAFVHFHYRDLRFEMSIEDFLGFSRTMADARERLRPMLFRPLADLFEQLNEHNILYVVLRNWEGLPANVQVGPHSDLDLLVHPAHVAKLDELWATRRTQSEPYRVQRQVPVLAPSGEQSFILADIRTTDDGYMPEAFSHQLLARRAPDQMFFVLPPREHFLSLLYHATVHKGVMSADYAQKLVLLADAAGITFPGGRVNDLAHHVALLREHGIEPVEPQDISVLPKLPFVDPLETVVSSRLLDIHEGRVYMSRVHIVDDVVRKQTSFDLAAREQSLLSRLTGPHFPRALGSGSRDGWTTCDLELVDGVPLTESECTPELVRGCIDILEELAVTRIVHRDIKPDNLLVRHGRPVLIDFGWAVAPDLPHVTPAGLGDSGRAPEGFCDTYAMGVALAGLCGDIPELAYVIEAMTRPDIADRATDPDVLRSMLESPPNPAEAREAAALLAARFAAEPETVEAPPPERVHVIAFADELIAAPGLLERMPARYPDATLIAYAPDADADEIAPRLEQALDGTEVDVVLVPVPRDPASEEGLAAAAVALLSATPGEGAFANLPLVEADAAPLVSIVIPVHNRLDLTKQCLDAIRAATPEPAYEVVVVDNASTDGTAEFLRTEEAAGRVRAAINETNEGFGGACNRGVEMGRGELVVLLNNDTIPRPGWLTPLVETLTSDTSVGIAGSRLLYPDGTIQHAGIVWDAAGRLTHVHRGAAGDDPVVMQRRDFAAVTGACLIVRRDTFFELGAFDPAFHMYVEDVDLCIRAWDAGLRVVYRPDSVVVHLENASVSDVQWRDEQVIAGWKRLEERWSGRWPDEVRKLAWPHRLPGSPPHPAALCVVEDLIANPGLADDWARTHEGAKLVVYGEGYDPAGLARKLEQILASTVAVDVIALAAPHGTPPPPELLRSVTEVLRSDGALVA